MNQLLEVQRIDPEDLEEDQRHEQEEPIEETTMVLWDWAPTLGLNEEERAEEIQVSSVNITTRRKGLVVDQSLVFPNMRRENETVKKIIVTTQTQHKENLVNIKETRPMITKHVKNVANKLEIIRKTRRNLIWDITSWKIL